MVLFPSEKCREDDAAAQYWLVLLRYGCMWCTWDKRGTLDSNVEQHSCRIYSRSCGNVQMSILQNESVYFPSLFVPQNEKKFSTVLIEILSSYPVQEFKFPWVCFFFWFFFCFSSLFLPFSFPSASFSLRCWRFLFLLRSCTIRSCKTSYRLDL